jgi:ribosomal protein S6--L-glutamate ligase
VSTTHTTSTRAARRGRARLASIPGSGPRAAARLAGAHRPGRIWILTDRRYLDQRMPRALTDWLARAGHAPRLVVADDGPVFSHISPLADPVVPSAWSGLEPGDLVVARSRHPLALALLDEASARGAQTINAPSAVNRVRDKATCAVALARRGLPVPRTIIVQQPADLLELPESAFPIVVKPVYGDNARGVQIVPSRERIRDLGHSEELLLAQAYVDAEGYDVKLYVAGDHVWATRRPSPLLAPDADAVRVPVTPALRAIAEACRAEFGLRLFGVDVLESDEGLSIVDVNDFPNYTGLDEAPEAIGGLLLSAAMRDARADAGWALAA